MKISITLVKDQLILIYPSNQKLQRSVKTVDFSKIDSVSQRILGELQRGVQKEKYDKKDLSTLTELGKELSILIFPKELIVLLSRSGGSLNLEMDEKLFSIPWEILFLKDQFLSLKFNLGRTIVIDSSMEQPNLKSHLKGTVKAVVIVSDPDRDLLHAVDEGNIIVRILDKEENVSVRLVVDPSIATVRELLGQYDIVHYIGHTVEDSKMHSPAWKFDDGLLGVTDIAELSVHSSMPYLIYSSACPGVRTDLTPVSKQLTGAFIQGGTQHYIGSLWDLPDGSSFEFSSLFFQLLFKTSVGASLRGARKGTMLKSGSSLWSLFFHCGDPDFKFKSEGKESIEPTKLGVRGDVPWKRVLNKSKEEKTVFSTFLIGGIVASIIIILLFSLLHFSREYFIKRSGKIEVVVSAPPYLNFNKKISFNGFSKGTKGLSNEIFRKEQCFIKHLTYISGVSVIDGRKAGGTAETTIEISGRVVSGENGPKILLLIHRKKDRVILYIDEFYLFNKGEEQCIKLAEWLKRKYQL
jgi:CHAT domain-containing protein